MSKQQQKQDNSLRMAGLGALIAVPVITVASAFMLYRVAAPSEYLVKTGLFVNGTMGMSVSRKGFLLPGQKLQRVEMTPRNLNFTLKCLSQQYLPFKMPVTYTVTPFDPVGTSYPELDGFGETSEISGEDLFKRYAQKMHVLDNDAFNETLLGVIHGETRVLAARMSIDAINDDRDAFRDDVIKRVQAILLPYGVRVDNANIAELIEDQREKGHLGYLQARERKKLAIAVQESEVDVADAEQMGDIGKKVREAKTRQEIARLETETKTYEYETQKQMAERYASLAEAQADSQRREDVSKIEAQAAAALKKEELQHAIELARAQQELAAKKALLFTSAKVQAECDVAEAEGKRDASVIESEGNAQALERLAIAHQREGEAKAAALRAELMAKAEGQAAMLEAQATGTRNLVTACGGNPQLLEPVLNIYNHVPQKIAEEGAKAVQGLNPQIWSLSGEDAGSSVARLVGGMAPVVDMFKRHGVFNALTSPIEATKPTAAKSTDAKPVD